MSIKMIDPPAGRQSTTNSKGDIIETTKEMASAVLNLVSPASPLTRTDQTKKRRGKAKERKGMIMQAGGSPGLPGS